MRISEDLITKYNKPIPRYTSYPPANYFNDELDTERYIHFIEQSNKEIPSNISLYIHIPFCNKLCHFCGCNAQIKQSEDVIHSYVEAVIEEIILTAKHISKQRKLSQIHYGGGTPNAIDSKHLLAINQTIFDNFDCSDNPEIAIECNPAYLDEAYIEDLHRAKFNRFSIGIQDFDPKVLKIVNRNTSNLDVIKLVELLRKNGALVNLDFIYGLPSQTVESFTKNILKAIEIKPDRLVTFSYAHVPWVKKAQAILEKTGLPSSDEKLKMFKKAFELLTSNGYKSIGLDHYALDKDELSVAAKEKQLHRNFQGYCTKYSTGQVYAIGVSGISQLNSVYTQNTKDIKEYIENIRKQKFSIKKHYQLNEKEIIIREIINNFMCNNFVDFEDIAIQFGKSIPEIKNIVEYQEQKFKGYLEDKLIKLTKNRIELLPDALLFIRNIASEFDPLMKNNSKNFSKSV